MDEDTKIEVGSFCEEVMSHPYFNSVWAQFETSMCHTLLSTTPQQRAEREQTYDQFNGARQFLEFMASIVTEKNDILKQRSIQLEEEHQDELQAEELDY